MIIKIQDVGYEAFAQLANLLAEPKVRTDDDYPLLLLKDATQKDDSFNVVLELLEAHPENMKLTPRRVLIDLVDVLGMFPDE